MASPEQAILDFLEWTIFAHERGFATGSAADLCFSQLAW